MTFMIVVRARGSQPWRRFIKNNQIRIVHRHGQFSPRHTLQYLPIFCIHRLSQRIRGAFCFLFGFFSRQPESSKRGDKFMRSHPMYMFSFSGRADTDVRCRVFHGFIPNNRTSPWVGCLPISSLNNVDFPAIESGFQSHLHSVQAICRLWLGICRRFSTLLNITTGACGCGDIASLCFSFLCQVWNHSRVTSIEETRTLRT